MLSLNPRKSRALGARALVAGLLTAGTAGLSACGGSDLPKGDLTVRPPGDKTGFVAKVAITEPRSGQVVEGRRFTIRGTAAPIGSEVRIDTGIGQYRVLVRGSGKWGLHDITLPPRGNATIRVSIRGTLAEDIARDSVKFKSR